MVFRTVVLPGFARATSENWSAVEIASPALLTRANSGASCQSLMLSRCQYFLPADPSAAEHTRCIARIAKEILWTNKKWHEKSPIDRPPPPLTTDHAHRLTPLSRTHTRLSRSTESVHSTRIATPSLPVLTTRTTARPDPTRPTRPHT